MYQSSCSELLVDTKIESPEKFYNMLKELMKKYNWTTSPPLTKKRLAQLKLVETRILEVEDYNERQTVRKKAPHITLIDNKGNKAFVEYGSNGYAKLGFYIDADGDYNSKAYPFLAGVEDTQGKVKAYDGGHKGPYDRWREKRWKQYR